MLLAENFQPFSNGTAAKFRPSGDDDARWFAAGVRINDRDFFHFIFNHGWPQTNTDDERQGASLRARRRELGRVRSSQRRARSDAPYLRLGNPCPSVSIRG